MMSRRLLKGRSFPGKVLITRRSDPLDNSTMRSPDNHGSLRDSETGPSQLADGSFEVRAVLISNVCGYVIYLLLKFITLN